MNSKGLVLLKGFRDFIARGNVVDLAVAVVVGAAFTTLVNSLVDGIFNPLMGAVFNSSNLENSLIVTLPTFSNGHTQLKFGLVLASVIKFVLVSAVIYFVIVTPLKRLKNLSDNLNVKNLPKPLGALANLLVDTPESNPSVNAASADNESPPPPDSKKTEINLLSEIRDLLKSQNSRLTAPEDLKRKETKD